MVMFKGPGWCARCVAVSGRLWEWWGAREPGAGRRHGQVTQCSLDIYSQYCPHTTHPHLPTNNKHSLRHGVNGPSANEVWVAGCRVPCRHTTVPWRAGELERWRRVEQWDITDLRSHLTSLCRRYKMWCPLSTVHTNTNQQATYIPSSSSALPRHKRILHCDHKGN